MKHILNTNQQFINKAILKHGDIYDYSKADYTGAKNKVDILCKKHGLFSQNASSHLYGAGCPKCGKEKSINKRRKWDASSFKKECEKLHPNLKFNKTKYSNPKTKVTVTCPHHGEYLVSPFSLLKGHGCKKCSLCGVKSDYSEVLRECDFVHGNFYNYNNVNVELTLAEKQEIICPIHGVFHQNLTDHKNGRGCYQCGVDKTKKYAKQNPSGWSYSNWIKASRKSKNFDSFKLYLIKCYNQEETFFKVGRTFLSLRKRFENLPYNYEVVDIIKGEARFICQREWEVKSKNKLNTYKPNINFSGCNECFSKRIDIYA